MHDSAGSKYNQIIRQDDEYKKMESILSPYKMRKINDEEIPQLCDFATNLFGFETVPAEVLSEVEKWSQRALFVRIVEDKISGFLALMPLTSAGHSALRSGQMYGTNIKKEWVASPDMPLEAGLLWGMGGHSKRDQRAVVFALMSIWNNMFPGMPTYSRAATEHGLRLMVRMGYEKVLSMPGRPDLWGRDAFPVDSVMSKSEYKSNEVEVA